MRNAAHPRIRFGAGSVWQLRVELEAITPAVWRRLLLSERAALHEVHDVIERSMRRDPNGSYHFDIDGVRYADADQPVRGRDALGVALASLGLHPGARFLHVSDAGAEPWRHVVTLESVTPRHVGQRLPACTGGGRAAPPDACGGPSEFRDLLAWLHDPMDPRGAEWRMGLPEDFDAEFLDVTAVNATLAKVPKRRPAA